MEVVKKDRHRQWGQEREKERKRDAMPECQVVSHVALPGFWVLLASIYLLQRICSPFTFSPTLFPCTCVHTHTR